jgi:hypothetical protein
MARTDVYNEVSKAAHAIARDVAESVIECLHWHAKNEIKPSEYDTRDDWDSEIRGELDELIHQECDTALTYTSDQWCLAWGLPDSSDSPEDLGGDGFDSLLTAKAYLNLREYVGSWDYDEAIGVMLDEIEARAPKGAATESEGGAS